MSTGARPRTIVAPQALYFLNSGFVHRTASLIAERQTSQTAAQSAASVAVEEIVQQCFEALVNRRADAREQAVLTSYLREQAVGPPGLSKHDLTKLCQTILSSTQFQYLE